MEFLKDINATAVMLWIIPGCFVALFRSFSLNGRFPSFSKDDIAALILSSVVYDFLIQSFLSEKPFDRQALSDELMPTQWLPVLIVIPALAGFGLGLIESNDVVGKLLRRFGFAFPSPTPTAWETLFRELTIGSVLIVTLKDGAIVYGRWTRGVGLSSASTDPDMLDIFVGETGELDAQGRYQIKMPRRGIYIAASEVRWIEVIQG